MTTISPTLTSQLAWSLNQQRIFDAVLASEAQFTTTWKRSSLLISAVAGSGKTTTLKEIIRLVLAKGCSVAYVMFNKAPVEEMRAKCQASGITSSSLTIDTAHAFGMKALRARFGHKLRIDKDKCRSLYRELFHERGAYLLEKTVLKLVDHAKNLGLGAGDPEGEGLHLQNALWDVVNHHGLETEDESIDMGQCIKRTLGVLYKSNQDTSSVDFSDMIYLPVLHNIRLEQFDYVLVDECQDTNATKRALYRLMLKPGGSLIAVGDRHQAIYGFTGADSNALDLFIEHFGCIEYPLDICYRCAPHIVKYAQKWVKTILPRESTVDLDEQSEPPIERKVRRIEYKSFVDQLYSEIYGTAVGIKEHIPHDQWNLGPGDAFLCRNNAPNVRMCFVLLRRSIGCRIEGRDIGIQLVKIVESLEADTLLTMQKRLDDYCQHEVAKALRKEDDYAAEIVRDKCEAISLFIEDGIKRGDTPQQIVYKIRDLFTDATDTKTPKDLVVLSSVHKAKGREWPRVFLLDRDQYMPSKYARQPWALAQETNLIYVAVTRAMNDLIEITNMP